MKKIILCVTLISVTLVHGQLRQNRNSSFPNTNTAAVNTPKFVPEKLAGLLIYDLKKTTKKIGVKAKKGNGSDVVKAVEKYNKAIKDLTRINTMSFKELTTLYETTRKIVTETRDMSLMRNFQKRVGEVVNPIKKQAELEQDKLDAALGKLLNEKQMKNWKSYAEKERKSLVPKQVRQPMPSRNMNRRRGF